MANISESIRKLSREHLRKMFARRRLDGIDYPTLADDCLKHEYHYEKFLKCPLFELMDFLGNTLKLSADKIKSLVEHRNNEYGREYYREYKKLKQILISCEPDNERWKRQRKPGKQQTLVSQEMPGPQTSPPDNSGAGTSKMSDLSSLTSPKKTKADQKLFYDECYGKDDDTNKVMAQPDTAINDTEWREEIDSIMETIGSTSSVFDDVGNSVDNLQSIALSGEQPTTSSQGLLTSGISRSVTRAASTASEEENLRNKFSRMLELNISTNFKETELNHSQVYATDPIIGAFVGEAHADDLDSLYILLRSWTFKEETLLKTKIFLSKPTDKQIPLLEDKWERMGQLRKFPFNVVIRGDERFMSQMNHFEQCKGEHTYAKLCNEKPELINDVIHSLGLTILQYFALQCDTVFNHMVMKALCVQFPIFRIKSDAKVMNYELKHKILNYVGNARERVSQAVLKYIPPLVRDTLKIKDGNKTCKAISIMAFNGFKLTERRASETINKPIEDRHDTDYANMLSMLDGFRDKRTPVQNRISEFYGAKTFKSYCDTKKYITFTGPLMRTMFGYSQAPYDTYCSGLLDMYEAIKEDDSLSQDIDKSICEADKVRMRDAAITFIMHELGCSISDDYNHADQIGPKRNAKRWGPLIVSQDLQYYVLLNTIPMGPMSLSDSFFVLYHNQVMFDQKFSVFNRVMYCIEKCFLRYDITKFDSVGGSKKPINKILNLMKLESL